MKGTAARVALLLGLTGAALYVRGGTSPLGFLHFLGAAFLLTLVPGRILLRRLDLEMDALEETTLSVVVGASLTAGAFWVFGAAGEAQAFPLWPLAMAVLAIPGSARLLGSTPPGPPATLLRPPSTVPWWPIATLVVLGILPLLAVPFYYRNLVPLAGGRLSFSFLADPVLHLAFANELTHSIPPQDPLLPGQMTPYHHGMDLLAAAFSRGAGLATTDVVVRFLPTLFSTVTLLAAFCFARTWVASSGAALISATLVVFGEDFSFLPGLWFRSPEPWAPLYFGVPTVVSLFLMNPMLPALGVLLSGLLCLTRWLDDRRQTSWLVLAGGLFAALAQIKVFTGAHIAAALVIAGLVQAARSRDRRLLIAALATGLFLTPLAVTLLARGGGGVAVSLRLTSYVPAALYRLGLLESPLGRPVAALMSEPPSALGVVLFLVFALPIFLVGCLGLRVLALPSVFRQAGSSEATAIRRLVATFVLMGPLLTLSSHVGAPGVPPDQQYNNAVWFFVESKYLAWFFVVERLTAWGTGRNAPRRVALYALTLLGSLPSTVQYLIVQATTPQLVALGPGLLEVARFLKEDARPGAILMARDEVMAPLVSLTRCRGNLVSPSITPLGEARRRRDLVDRFWTAWNADGESEKVRPQILAELNVDYVVIRKARDRPTPSPGWDSWTPCFENAGYLLHCRRRGQ